MAIIIDEKKDGNEKLFTLHTAHATYQMKADSLGTLLHLYYGKRTDDSDKFYILSYRNRGFSGNPYEVGKEIKNYSLDVLPQEYSCFGTGDYRISGLKVKNGDGSSATALRFREYRTEKGKYAIPGLPAVYAGEEEAQTLELILEDGASGLEVHLLYGVLEDIDIITRAVKIKNGGTEKVVLEKAASMNLDWISGDYDWITFYGRHVMERNVQRSALGHGVSAIGSVRGTSSHHYNPFSILCERCADEEEKEDPDLIRAMSGLNGGMGFSGHLCGALTGGCCLLGYFCGKGETEEIEDPKASELIRELVAWFEETVGGAYGGCDCSRILEDDPSNKMKRCPEVVESVFMKCMELLQENGMLA